MAATTGSKGSKARDLASGAVAGAVLVLSIVALRALQETPDLRVRPALPVVAAVTDDGEPDVAMGYAPALDDDVAIRVPSRVAVELGSANEERPRLDLEAIEAENLRLHAALTELDPRRADIAALVAANELRHADLVRELAELVLVDAESVASDPRELLDVLLRFSDAAGLAAAPRTPQGRVVEPEPRAPDVVLSFEAADTRGVVEVAGGADASWHAEMLTLHVQVKLTEVPDGWNGDPLEFDVLACVECGTGGVGKFRLRSGGTTAAGPPRMSLCGSWTEEGSEVVRMPWRGGEELRRSVASDFADLRRSAADFFACLRSLR